MEWLLVLISYGFIVLVGIFCMIAPFMLDDDLETYAKHGDGLSNHAAHGQPTCRSARAGEVTQGRDTSPASQNSTERRAE